MRGHRHISLEALKRLDLDEVWWLVSPQNPLKPARGMAPFAARLAQPRRRSAGSSAHPRSSISRRGSAPATPSTRWRRCAGAFRAPLRLADGRRQPAADPALEALAGDRSARPGCGLRPAHLLLAGAGGIGGAALSPPPRGARRGAAARRDEAAGLDVPPGAARPELGHGSAPSAQARKPWRSNHTKWPRSPPLAPRTPPPARRLGRPAELLALVLATSTTARPRTSSSSTSPARPTIADYMVIASGRSPRQVVALAEHRRGGTVAARARRRSRGCRRATGC